MVYQTIKWHEKGQENTRIYLDNEKKDIDRLVAILTEQTTNFYFKELQIAEAKRQGKESFDDEKFMKVKNKEKHE